MCAGNVAFAIGEVVKTYGRRGMIVANNTDERRDGNGNLLETYEWDSFWVEHTEDAIAPRVLYIGDSISIPTRVELNRLLDGMMRVDSISTSKALDNPSFVETVRVFVRQQPKPYDIILFNNGLHGWHLNDSEAYIREYRHIITELRTLLTGASWTLLLTTYIADPKRNQRVICRNAAVRDMAEKNHMKMIDLYAPTSICSDLLSEDGVHWRAEGYHLLAETILHSFLPTS